MALFSILFILLLNVISSSSHTVYFEGQAPKVVQQANTNYEIKKSNPGIVITNFGDDTIQFNNGDDSDGISVGIIQKVYTLISSNPPSMANCKIYSLPDNQLRTDLHHQLEFGVPFGSFFNSNTSISLSCYKANATDFMLVVQSKNNANFLGYSIYASGIPPTQFGMDKEIVFTTISLEPAVPYIRSLTFLTGSYFEVGDSTPQKPPSWNVTAAFVNSVIPTNNYLFTTYFLKAKVTMEIVSHLNVCSGKRTITQADMDQNGVFKFPYVDLNGGYDCSFEIIPPSKEYYTKVQMGGFLTTSFYLDLYYKKEFARTFTIPGNNLLTGTYYFPNGGVLEFDSGNDGYATITFIITFIKLPIAPAINKEFTDSGQGNLTTLAGIISLFTAKDAANTSLTVLSVNQNPYSLEVKTSLDYCFLTIRYDSGDIERYSLREFTVFRTPTLFKKAYFQCVEPPQHQGDVIIVVGNSSDWLTVCQIAASYADCLNEITFPENPNCNGFNYLIQTKGHIQYNTTITRIDSEPETDVLVFRGIFSGNYIGSISRRTLPFTSDDDCVSYLGVSTSNITLHWKTATVSTTTQPMTDINTTPSLEFTTKPAISCLSMFFVLLLSFLV